MIEIMNMRDEKPSKPYDFHIDRRSPVGNPYPMHGEATRDAVCDDYKAHFDKMVAHNDVQFVGYLETIKKALAIHGRVRLFCWCAPKRCHGETIKAWLESNV